MGSDQPTDAATAAAARAPLARSAPRRPARSRGSSTRSAATTTSPTARSRRPCSSRSSSAGRCCSKARRASARPRSPRCSPPALGTRLIRLQCYEGLDVNTAVYEWNYPRQMLEIRLLEARGEIDQASAHDIFGAEFLLKRPLLQAIEAHRRRRAGAADRRDRPRRRGVRGVPARDALRLPGHDPRDRHHPGRAGRRAWSSPPTGRARSTTRSSGAASTTGSTTRRRRRSSDRLDPRARRARAPGPRGGRRSCSGCASADLTKLPGVAETLDWASALLSLGAAELARTWSTRRWASSSSTRRTSARCAARPPRRTSPRRRPRLSPG